MRHAVVVSVMIALVCWPFVAQSAEPQERLRSLVEKRRWEEAAALLPVVDATGAETDTTVLAEYATICRYAGDLNGFLRYRLRVLWSPQDGPNEYTAINVARDLARFANANQLLSPDSVIAGYALHLQGRSVPGQEMLEAFRRTALASNQTDVRFHVAGFMLNEIPEAAVKGAIARSDGTAILASLQLLGSRPVPVVAVPEVVKAYEQAGDIKNAVRVAYEGTWASPTWRGRPTDGDPEMVKLAAGIAQRGKYRSPYLLVEAWKDHLAGRSARAIAVFESLAVLPALDSSGREDERLPVARFLAGDVWMARKQYLNALSWYHSGASTAYRRWYRGYYEYIVNWQVETPDEISPFHRTLSCVRQAQVLLKMQKPGLAAYEIRGLLVSDRYNVRDLLASGSPGYPLEHYVFEGTALDRLAHEIVAQVDSAIAARPSMSSFKGTPYEIPEAPDDPAEGDLIYTPEGLLTQRENSVQKATRIWDEYQRRKDSNSQLEAETAARAAEAKRLEALRAAEAQAKTFASTERITGPRFSDRGPCIRCKGRGTLYIPPDMVQGQTWSSVSKQMLDTKIYTSGYLKRCHWCGGTGQR